LNARMTLQRLMAHAPKPNIAHSAIGLGSGTIV
jgi:hypothetical protein